MLKKQTILAHVSLMAYRKCTAAQQVPDALSRTDNTMEMWLLTHPLKETTTGNVTYTLEFQQRFHFSISDLCARMSQWQFSGGKNCVSVEDDSTNE